MSETQTQQKNYKLTTKNLFNHFLLLHDFLFNFTKTKARNKIYLNTQIDVSTIMNNATSAGTKFGYFSSLTSLVVYCLRSKSLTNKFIAGFLWMYWINHFATLGSYCGAILRIPSAYEKVANYYIQYENSPNQLDILYDSMESNQQYQDTHQILCKVFPEQHKSSGSTFTSNDYFIKNKEKYSLGEYSEKNSKKLQYFDSFLTRYAYYSFTRWLYRVQLFMGLQQE